MRYNYVIVIAENDKVGKLKAEVRVNGALVEAPIIDNTIDVEFAVNEVVTLTIYRDNFEGYVMPPLYVLKDHKVGSDIVAVEGVVIGATEVAEDTSPRPAWPGVEIEPVEPPSLPKETSTPDEPEDDDEQVSVAPANPDVG